MAFSMAPRRPIGAPDLASSCPPARPNPGLGRLGLPARARFQAHGPSGKRLSIAPALSRALWMLSKKRRKKAQHQQHRPCTAAAPALLRTCVCHHCCCMCWCVYGSFNRFLSVFSRFLRSKLSKKFCCCDGALHKSLRPKSFAKFGWLSPK